MSSGGYFNKDSLKNKLSQIEELIKDEHLWDDPSNAQKILKEKADLEEEILRVEKFESDFNYLQELLPLAKEDSSIINDLFANLSDLTNDLDTYKLDLLLSDPADRNDCYIEIHAGAGGTEAQDWAQMLLRMYARWCADHNRTVEYIEENIGDEAGIKSATIKVMGHNSYGWLKSESGVHRLVRISPFDANARRHTSFSSVSVYPVIDDSIEVSIEAKDLRIDTYRASGAGGQHINKTDSAVRITHIPTNIVVQSQNQRSQHQNRDTAMNMLKARLYQIELEKQLREKQKLNDAKLDNAWGSQIRSYVAQPYQMVKDLRTGEEIHNFQSVLDGNIDKFLKAYLIRFKSKE